MTTLNKTICLLSVLILFACGSADKDATNESKNSTPDIHVDLKEIKEVGKLKVSTTYSGTSYFLYRGHPMGFEYELLERFAKHLGVELEIVIEKDIDNIVTNLNAGKVDLMAYGLTITSDRKEKISFSDYVYLTHQVLVQKKPDNWRKMKWSNIEKTLIHDALELIDDTISIREKTAYMERLTNLSAEMGGNIYIDTLSGELSTDEIIKMVVDGEIKYTVADDNIAKIISSYYPVLDIDVPISFSQRAAWATRSSSPELLKELNKWLIAFKKETDYYVIYNKYFKNKRDFNKRIKSDFYSLNSNKISKYDDLIKQQAVKLGWDWRLVSSLIYQESRFDASAKSWAGAGGLMQVMPATAKELGITNRHDPTQSVVGGTKYLKILWNRFDSIPDDVQRQKMVMASYNCGYSHVVDAQQLAEKRGLDKKLWDDNVEKMILALSYRKNFTDPVVKYGYVRGLEPYNYVAQIFERYEHYKDFIKE